MTTRNSITFLDPETGDVVKHVELDQPRNLSNVLTSYRTSHIVDDLARQVGLDADEMRVPEHRRHLDPVGRLLVGHGTGAAKTTQVSEHVFETRRPFVLRAGKMTGPNSCTYVGTDVREFTVVNVKNYAA